MNESVYPNSYGVFIPGKAGRIFSQIYTPGGCGKKPVIILCHGFPGNERIMDFAVFLREQGFCTVSFHYRGSWGSDGSYSLHGAMEDAESVLDYVLTDPFGCFDTSKVFVLGHSWGGCVGARLLGTRSEVKAGALIMPADMCRIMTELFNEQIQAEFTEGCQWLRDLSPEKMLAEVEEEPERYSIPAYAEGIAGKPVLLVGGTMDTLITVEDNIRPLAELLKMRGTHPLVRYYETDHGINLQRDTIKCDLARFFNSCL